MLPVPKQFDDYCTKVAAYLRAREANLLRGKPDLLQSLDETTDLDLLKKWSWLSTIVGALVSCLAFPLALNVLHIIAPPIIMQLLVSIMKVCMGLTFAMFALAAYFTFFVPTNQGDGR
jgi:hypothetical protein